VPTYSGGNPTVLNAAVFTVDSNGAPTAVSSTTPLPTTRGAPTAANVLNGFQTFTSTTGATTLLTVPAGRTWVGTIGAACVTAIAAASSTAGQARAVIASAGTGVTPAAGTLLAVEADAGANAATGTVGSNNAAHHSMPLTLIAPVGNTVTLTVVTTQAGTTTRVDTFASGSLI
jgi:hypothetical protein